MLFLLLTWSIQLANIYATQDLECKFSKGSKLTKYRLANKVQADLRTECLSKQTFGTIEALEFSLYQNPGNYHYVELYKIVRENCMNINQLAIKWLYIDRPYLNYEFVSQEGGEQWHQRYNFPEIDDNQKGGEGGEGNKEECFMSKFSPERCADGGYVHMFPTFYKHCVIFEMGLYPKDWIEVGILPYLAYIRGFWMFAEVLGLSYFLYLS